MSLLEFAKSLDSTSLSTTIKTVSWIVPVLQCLHIVMVGMVFISITMISLRLMGRARMDESLAQVWHRFAGFFWTGVVVMVVTGVLLTISEPIREFMTLSFRLKMLFLVICVISAVSFGRAMRQATAVEAGTSSGMRMTAAVTLVLWVAIILLGRWIAYDDSIFGSWSPAILQRGGAV